MGTDGASPLSATVSGSNPFGVRSHLVPSSATEEPTRDNTILLMTKYGDRFVRRDQVKRNVQAIGEWKVAMSNTSKEHAGNPDAAGRKQVITARARVLPPNSACTETYLLAGVFPGQKEAAAFLTYLRTKFCRFLLSLRVATQHITRGCFAFVPAVPTDRIWTDEDLYAHFGLDEEEVAHIERLIKEMPG